MSGSAPPDMRRGRKQNWTPGFHPVWEDRPPSRGSIPPSPETRISGPGTKRTSQEIMRTSKVRNAIINRRLNKEKIQEKVLPSDFQLQGGDRTPKRSSLGLTLIVGGVPCTACADTGSETNILSKRFAHDLGLRTGEGRLDIPLRELQLGNGKLVCPISLVSTFVEFPGEENTRQECSFYVLQICETPIIMGSQFLESTRCMTSNKHRLSTRLTLPGELPAFKSIGPTKRRLSCFVDETFVYAIADTGSELDLMSLDFAREYGYYSEHDDKEICQPPQLPSLKPRNRKDGGLLRVRLADGTELETFGDVLVQISLGHRTNSPIIRPFYIINDLPADIILGQDLLHETDAFIRYEHCFVEIHDSSKAFELNRFVWLGSCEKRFLNVRKFFTTRSNNSNTASVEQQLIDNYTRECRRRERAARTIAALQGAQLVAAEEKENRQKANYEHQKGRVIGILKQRINERNTRECHRRERAEKEISAIQDPHRAATARTGETQMQEDYDTERQQAVAIFSSAQARGP